MDRRAGRPPGGTPAARTDESLRGIAADSGLRVFVVGVGILVVQIVIVQVEILVIVVEVVVTEVLVVELVLVVFVGVLFGVLEVLLVGVLQVNGGPLFGLLAELGGDFLTGLVGFAVTATLASAAASVVTVAPSTTRATGNDTLAPGSDSSFSTLTTSPTATLYCLPPVLTIA